MNWIRFLIRLGILILAAAIIIWIWINSARVSEAFLLSLIAYLLIGVVVAYLERWWQEWGWEGLGDLVFLAGLWGAVNLIKLLTDFIEEAISRNKGVRNGRR